ncbi:type 4a pilus biogenesis protein PilO [Motiliproteus sp. MSK22-1]|uniref:type 4a pilus biogenesis protein PilO n=1 Tax=Motiliproteus sp. MSK22-1 TaxID=1897630 RepID=UPI000978A4C5|nr:type 4a pilus biogenesis protein PilO [Motiliproteus sp. MSK22-1]OMH28052.1 pilus assembly protein PilP [Motiliproteus sp. MSK22-1]
MLTGFKNSFRGFDINNLDFSAAGSWPIGVKVVFYLLILIAGITGGYHFYIKDLVTAHEQEVRKEPDLKDQYRIKAYQVANLEALKQQMVDVEERFSELLKQLPTDTEVPGLLEDITDIGQNSGLSFDVISLAPEKKVKFYIELPINIKVKGSYHQLGEFVSGVAALPRIVTLHDFTISPISRDGDLSMTIAARTYRYDDK